LGFLNSAPAELKEALDRSVQLLWSFHVDLHRSRSVSRYQSDITHKEWRAIEPLLPGQGTSGRPPFVSMMLFKILVI
jgi:hypothetical protein